MSEIHLPPRVRPVLKLLLRGYSEKQVASELKLSQHTVHEYVKLVYKRFGVNSRAELIVACYEERTRRRIVEEKCR